MVFPQDVPAQLHLSIEAVFRSWNNKRAIDYRKLERIPDDLGTAVNVQTMVFGNKGDTSATGVGFTRNPADGTNERYGDFLINAQGEDVVAGIRNTQAISELADVLPEAAAELLEVFTTLENHYRDMCDIEFTIEQGKLWMLQTRVGKRTARAALKIAVDMVSRGHHHQGGSGTPHRPRAARPASASAVRRDGHVRRRRQGPERVAGRGSWRGGLLGGRRPRRRPPPGSKVILVRWETTPDDLHGMIAAQGHPHEPRRKDVSRGRGGPRHGQAVRLRCREAQDRRRAARGQDRRDGHRA